MKEKERKRAKEDAYLLQMLSLFKVDYILHEKEYYTSLGFLYVPKIKNLEAPKFKLVFPLKI